MTSRADPDRPDVANADRWSGCDESRPGRVLVAGEVLGGIPGLGGRVVGHTDTQRIRVGGDHVGVVTRRVPPLLEELGRGCTFCIIKSVLSVS